ncbi:hypothetical protein [Streptomyces cinereospinus]|uniref:Uncharacterized protein n=1 Tax=Streptomyces cinereospinus TaxID=285561 RepID=A0ABV5N5L9_9ACTN
MQRRILVAPPSGVFAGMPAATASAWAGAPFRLWARVANTSRRPAASTGRRRQQLARLGEVHGAEDAVQHVVRAGHRLWVGHRVGLHEAQTRREVGAQAGGRAVLGGRGVDGDAPGRLVMNRQVCRVADWAGAEVARTAAA